MPRGHPIILLKSNEFNKAAVSVKRSIAYQPVKDVINMHQTNVKILIGQFSKHVNHHLDT